MITLSDLNKAAQVKKAEKETMEMLGQVVNAGINAGKKVLSVAEAAKEAVAGVFPVSNNALDSAKHDILMVVAGVQQRVETIEEELQISTEVDEEASEQMVEGYMAVMEARRKRAKAKKAEEAQVAPAPETPVAEVPVVQTPAPAEKPARLSAGNKMRVRFDDIPKAQN